MDKLIIDICALGVSLLALASSGFTFWFYERKLKKQDAKINEYQLKLFEKSEEEEKHAKIEANIYEHKNYIFRTKIYNSGKSVARNVACKLINAPRGLSIRGDNAPFPYLNPQQSIEIIIEDVTEEAWIDVEFTWDDDSATGNRSTQCLQLM